VCAPGLEKKNLFGDEMNAPRSLTLYKHRHDGSLFFDSGSAREQSRFCKQGTIHERRALCRLFRVLSFLVAVSYARALRTEGYMSEMFFSVKFYHLSLCTRGTRSSQSEEKGLQNAFFYYEENMSRDVNEDLFDARMKELLLISRLVLGSSILRPFCPRKRARTMGR